MTKEEIIKKGQFHLNEHRPDYSELRINLYLDFFEKEMEILFANLPSLSSEPQMTLITETINELLCLDQTNKDWLSDQIWKHYEIYVENVSYGMVPYEGFDSESEANRAYFKVYSREDAYNAVKLKEIWADMDFTEFRNFNLVFKCPWDDEHGINIGVINGKFDSIN